MQEITSTVKEYILKEFLPGENPEELTSSTPLITGGILDSIATLRLVAFLEETYKIELKPHEVDADNLDNVASITKLVQSKLQQS